jgi:S1-C subfamily serine protease
MFRPLGIKRGLVSALLLSLTWASYPVLAKAQEADTPALNVTAASERAAPVRVSPSTLKVNVTQQGFNPRLPWQKSSPVSRSGVGVVLAGKKILVTASMVRDASYIELEKPDSGMRVPAKVLALDFEANLALLEAAPEGAALLNDAVPLALAPVVRPGEEVQVWQLGRSGELMSSPLVVSKVLVSRYLLPSSSFLTMEANGILRAEATNVTLPVVRGGRLAGLLLRYDSNNQSATVLPAAIIEHFLVDVADGTYHGFPSVGMGTHPTLDPQFRDYLGLKPDQGGLFVGTVTPGGSADSLGLRAGDILLSLNGKAINSRGDIQDPLYGPIHYSHLLRSDGFVGDEFSARILRKGDELTLTGKLVHRKLVDDIVPALYTEKGPNYLVYGGLIFQELSMPYLQSFGEDWETKAPAQLVHLASNLSEARKQGFRRLVLLSAVLPVTGTQGYQSLGAVMVLSVNGQAIKDLQDLQNALKSPVEGLQRIELDESPHTIFLDAVQAEKDNVELLNGRYRINPLSRIH